MRTNVNGAVVFSAAVELLTYFRNSFHVQYLSSVLCILVGLFVMQRMTVEYKVIQQIKQNCYLSIYLTDLWCSTDRGGTGLHFQKMTLRRSTATLNLWLYIDLYFTF